MQVIVSQTLNLTMDSKYMYLINITQYLNI